MIFSIKMQRLRIEMVSLIVMIEMRLSPNINFAKIVSLKDYIRNRASSIVDHMVLNSGRSARYNSRNSGSGLLPLPL